MKINFKKTIPLILFAVFCAALIFNYCFTSGNKTIRHNVWVSGDFHTHTFLTDGSHTLEEVAEKAFQKYRLDWFANSEHGGAFSRDSEGIFWEKLGTPPEFKGNDAGKYGIYKNMWRWQSLSEYSLPLVEKISKRYKDNVIIHGLEWNCPSHEHVSVGIVKKSADPNRLPISDFEYSFDFLDRDTSRKDLPKHNVSHKDALAAIDYLKNNFQNSSYVIINHPSRKLMFSASDIRDMHNSGSGIMCGLEGIPGHQKDSSRGGYNSYSDKWDKIKIAKGRTYGGADYMAAKIGGLWDSLLSEGRNIWIFANSDFHSDDFANDFWPGEYAKNYTHVAATTEQGIVDGLKSGKTFAVTGDLIEMLDFTIISNGKTAEMGNHLNLNPGDPAVIKIRFRSPIKNNHGDSPAVDHVDLISGEMREKINPLDPAYNSDINPTAKILARFYKADWKTDQSGIVTIEYKLNSIKRNTYFRLRGTNLKVNTPNETDAEGNPLIDDLMGSNSADKAWADLWFYSNPIFLYASVRK